MWQRTSPTLRGPRNGACCLGEGAVPAVAHACIETRYTSLPVEIYMLRFERFMLRLGICKPKFKIFMRRCEVSVHRFEIHKHRILGAMHRCLAHTPRSKV